MEAPPEGAGVGDAWSPSEVAATVDSYLSMLSLEGKGVPYSKAEHRRALLGRLSPARTAASVEFKLANVSAVMVDIGLPYIRGYKPRGNYQEALAVEIRRRVTGSKLLADLVADSHSPIRAAHLRPGVGPPAMPRRTRPGRVIDYEALQAENRRLGEAGERLVLEYERRRLLANDRADLAEMARWISKEDGDGIGYDILSFTLDAQPRHIEVKTTKLGADAPFYVTSAEIAYSSDHAETYVLWRVYDVDTEPKFFTIDGDLSAVLELTPVTYRARLAEPHAAST